MRQKSITLRLPEDEYKAFTTICGERGYSKTGKIREFIRNLVKTEMSGVESSVGEWQRVSAAIRPGRPRPAGAKPPGPAGSPGPLPERGEVRLPEAAEPDEAWKL